MKSLVGIQVVDEVYNESSWNGSLDAPTKNALRDKFESLEIDIPTHVVSTIPATSPAGELYYETTTEKLYFTFDTNVFGQVYIAGSTVVETDDIQDEAVTYAKIQDVSATSRVLGRISSGAGIVEEVELKTVNGTSIFGSGNITVAGGDEGDGWLDAAPGSIEDGAGTLFLEGGTLDNFEASWPEIASAPPASGGITRTVVVTSGSATLGSTANTDYVYFVAGAHTMSLPAAAGNTNRYTVKNNHSADITVDTAGAETVEGVASLAIAPEDSLDFISDGTNWYIV